MCDSYPCKKEELFTSWAGNCFIKEQKSTQDFWPQTWRQASTGNLPSLSPKSKMEHNSPLSYRQEDRRYSWRKEGWSTLLSLRANLPTPRESPVKTVLYTHTATQDPGSPALDSKHSQETMRSWIRCLTPFGLKTEMVLSPGRVVTYWLEQQEMGITQSSLADEVVQL